MNKSNDDETDDEAKSTQTGTTVDASKIVKAVEVHQKGSEDILENVEADAVLESAAREAKEAEKFDHGKHDAGVKK